MAKEKQPLFTQLEFSDAQYATDVKTKSEHKLQRVKLGLMIAAGAQLAWLLLFLFPKMPDFLGTILVYLALGGAVVSYIIGGGLLTALLITWKFAKTLGWIGWVCVPFPADIFTGIFLTLVAFCVIPMFFIFVPLAIVLLNFVQVHKDYKAATEYLSYCTPVQETEE